MGRTKEEQEVEQLVGRFHQMAGLLNDLAAFMNGCELYLDPKDQQVDLGPIQKVIELRYMEAKEALVAAALAGKAVRGKLHSFGGRKQEVTYGTQRDALMLLLDTGDWFSVMEAIELGVPGQPTGVSSAIRVLRKELPIVGVYCADGTYRYRLLKFGEKEEDAVRSGKEIDRSGGKEEDNHG